MLKIEICLMVQITYLYDQTMTNMTGATTLNMNLTTSSIVDQVMIKMGTVYPALINHYKRNIYARYNSIYWYLDQQCELL